MRKKWLCLLAALAMLAPCWASAGRGATFYSNGDRETPRVAITIDDWYEPGLLPDFMAVAQTYDVKLTLYPCGINLHEEDRELWQAALDAGHEIGSHGYRHVGYTTLNNRQIIREYERFQEALDTTLGYTYMFLTVRLPFGDGRKQGENGPISPAIKAAGFGHVVFWDWDNTDDVEAAVKHVQNGSIILIHANRKDLRFFEALMEGLSGHAYEYVTVSELLGIQTRLDPEPEAE